MVHPVARTNHLVRVLALHITGRSWICRPKIVCPIRNLRLAPAHPHQKQPAGASTQQRSHKTLTHIIRQRSGTLYTPSKCFGQLILHLPKFKPKKG